MSESATPLPAGWTIGLHRVHNLTILTLHDFNGADREVGFCPLSPDGPQDRTVAALDDIPEPQLRKAAQTLITTFYDRTAEAQRNCDAFGQAVPDLQALLDRLHTQLPGCRTHLTIDSTDLTLVLTLTAAHRAAGPLHALLCDWPDSTTGDGLPDGIDQNLDKSGALTAALRQDRAVQFLTWYRDQPDDLRRH